MTSASFESIPLDSIIINRDSRQRRELRDLESLAESIRSVGLINPPVVTRELELVAGERRLEACRSLGWTSIPVQYAEDLDPLSLHLIELEENVKRLDLTWQEHNDAIATYHRLRASADKEWTQAKTARELGMTDSTVRKHLVVAEARNESEEVQGADKFSGALNIAQRRLERKKAGAERRLTATPTLLRPTVGDKPTAPPPEPKRAAEIHWASFLDFAATPTTEPFNLIHCDFPYGVNVGDKKGQGNAQTRGHYDDAPEIYFELLNTFMANLDNFCSPSAHLIFWYSMKYHAETIEILSQEWRVDPFPLVWHKSDNAGILPDPNRGPRRTYETALFASRGDRKVVKPVANSFAAATTKEFHTSEKPEAVLKHFFRMVCDEHSRVLDPTCGSGMAIKVAEAAGAEFALGLEINEEYAEAARQNCRL